MTTITKVEKVTKGWYMVEDYKIICIRGEWRVSKDHSLVGYYTSFAKAKAAIGVAA